MTISSDIRIAGPYLGNGATTDFPFAFKVFTRLDIQALVEDQVLVQPPTGEDPPMRRQRQLTPADYDVLIQSDQDNNPGGTLRLHEPLAEGLSLIILGAREYLQLTDFQNRSGFYPHVHENSFDHVVILIQQLREILSRTFTLPPGGWGDDFSFDFPPPKREHVIGWRYDEHGLKNVSYWDLVASIAFGDWHSETFTGNDTTTDFTLAKKPGSAATLHVSVGGVSQRPYIDFTVSGHVVHFLTAPPAPQEEGGNNIAVQYGLALPSQAEHTHGIDQIDGLREWLESLQDQIDALGDHQHDERYLKRVGNQTLDGVLTATDVVLADEEKSP